MGIFNYIDTFFFISLGITFILILLLVFHFKQQIVSLEHKNDTMFEIINNIVKEITYIKSAIFSQPHYQVNDKDEIINLTANEIHSKQNVENDKIIVSDDDYDSDTESDDDSDDGDDSDESDTETDDDSDDGDDSDDDRDECDDDIVDIERENELHNTGGVKVINVEFGDNIEVGDIMNELSDNAIDNDYDNVNEHEEHISALVQEIEQIIVEKIDGKDNHLENNDIIEQNEQNETSQQNEQNEQNEQKENIKEVYRKMTLIQLKALVISKGLTSDSSKMRKPELMKLLESNIDENN
jgi:hypothetical protein